MLLQDSPIALFNDEGFLLATTAWFDDHGYPLITFDAASWTSPADMHADLKQRLGFPDYYGRNLSALDDCLYDVSAGEYGLDPAAEGLVIVLRRYDAFAARLSGLDPVVLDILASRARGALLFGHRIVCLVRTERAVMTFPELGGARPTDWGFWPPGHQRRVPRARPPA